MNDKILNTNSNTNSSTLPIAIVGGGLGGAALALSLQRKGLPFVILEKDTHFKSRKQGYALTLQQVKYNVLILIYCDIIQYCMM